MKTSNILLSIILAVLLIGLTAFNLKMKCAYNKGDYKSPYYGMNFKPIASITNVNVLGANKYSVTIKQGAEEGIWIGNDSDGNVEWHQVGDVLTLDITTAAKAAKKDYFNDHLILVIKDVTRVKTESDFKDSDLTYYGYGRVVMEGFTLGKLELLMANRTNITLDNLIIDSLSATIGEKDLGVTKLTLDSENNIKVATFDIPGKSILILDNPTIDHVQYRLSSDANVSLKGKIVETLNN